MKIDALRSVPLFRALDDEAAAELCALLTMREVDGRHDICSIAANPGDAMYLIESGRVRISVKDADGHDAMLAEMSNGEFFGEMSLLDGNPVRPMRPRAPIRGSPFCRARSFAPSCARTRTSRSAS